MYATTEARPAILAVNAYTTTFEDQISSVVFTSTRSMVATGDETYSIPLEQVFDMVYAFRTGVTSV
jgi:hypothetical protein